jgi:hypothetical protein
MLNDPEGLFSKNYNRVNFLFAHQLAGNPMFELPNLVALARRMPDHRDTYWQNGDVKVYNNWEDGQKHRLSLDETITQIEHNNSLVMLKHTEQDPEYGPALQQVLARIVELSGEQMRCDVKVGEVLILISSPNRVTPYHMDGEVNFLLQVAGDKTFHVFDHTDRTLVTDSELEKFYAVSMVHAVYRPERQNDAVTYELRQGWGIHIPVTAPHWVQNKDNVSVALSVTYELRSIDRLIELYRVNRRLRNLGFNPSSPGDSPWRDQVKLAAYKSASAVRSLGKRRRASGPYAVWTPPAA